MIPPISETRLKLDRLGRDYGQDAQAKEVPRVRALCCVDAQEAHAPRTDIGGLMMDNATPENRCHPSHVTRFSFGASSYDEVCTLCGATDIAGGGWGKLRFPCSQAPKEGTTEPPLETPDQPYSNLFRLIEQQGEFITGNDGVAVFWPQQPGGGYNAHHLRAIADELDRRNAAVFASWDVVFRGIDDGPR